MTSPFAALATALFGRMITAGTNATIMDLQRKNERQSTRIEELNGTIAVAKVRHEKNVKKYEALERQVVLLEDHCERLSGRIEELIEGQGSAEIRLVDPNPYE